MARSIYDYTINKPDDFIQFVSNDYFAKEGFRLVNYKGEQVWKKGTGMLVAPSYIKLQYGNGVIHIEAWIKSLGEKPLDDSFVAAIPKSQHKDRVNTLISLLNQPVAVPNQQPVMAGGPAAPYSAPVNPGAGAAPGTPSQSGYAPQQPPTPVPVAVHNPTGKATLALIMGLVSFVGFFIPLVGVVCGGLGIAAGRSGRMSTQKGMATAGFVLSIIGLILSIVVWVLNFVLSMASVI